MEDLPFNLWSKLAWKEALQLLQPWLAVRLKQKEEWYAVRKRVEKNGKYEVTVVVVALTYICKANGLQVSGNIYQSLPKIYASRNVKELSVLGGVGQLEITCDEVCGAEQQCGQNGL